MSGPLSPSDETTSGEPPDVPIEELSAEPPPVAPRSRSVGPPPSLGSGGIRPTPLLAREAIARRGEGAPAAPRASTAPWGRIGSSPSPSTPPSERPPRGPSQLPGLAGLRGRPTSRSTLSPRLIAIFGGLFGLATVTSVVALLIQVAPPRDERSEIVEAQTSASAAEAFEKAPEVKKKVRVAIPGPWRLSELAKDPSIRIATGLTERKSFILALEEKGVPRAQTYRIMKSLEGLKKFDKTGRKDVFTVAMDRAGSKVRAFEYEVSPTEIYQSREGADGLLSGALLDMKIAEEEVTAAFYVGKKVSEAYKPAGLEDGILETIDEALNGRLSTDSFEEGSTIRVIAHEETALGLFARYKDIVAIEYRPADPAEKPVRMYQFKGEQSRGYFDERGRQPYKGGWRSPIPGAPVTSRFNPKRMHPVLHTVMPHQGTDFGVPMGTPIYSAYRGVVASVGPAGPSGNLVTINHPNGVTTGYAHMSRFAGLRVGDKVGTHQLVGYVGSTGRSTGPHLHFSAKKDGKFFDAETLQLDGERVMPTIDRPAFLAAKAELDARLDAIPLPEPPPEPATPAPSAEASAAAAAAPAGSGDPAVEAEPNQGDDGEEEPVGAAPAAVAAHVDDEGLEDLVGADLGSAKALTDDRAPPQ